MTRDAHERARHASTRTLGWTAGVPLLAAGTLAAAGPAAWPQLRGPGSLGPAHGRPLFKVRLGEMSLATPAIVGDALFVRTATKLYRIAASGTQ